MGCRSSRSRAFPAGIAAIWVSTNGTSGTRPAIPILQAEGGVGEHVGVGDDLQIDVQHNPDPDLVQVLVRRLVAANDRVAPREHHEQLAVFASANGDLVGGACGYTHWGWLFVSHLWVDESLRGTGVGSELMDRIEQAGASRGVGAAHLDTYDFQALAFYENLGYRLFGRLDNYPVGHTRYFLTKDLNNDRHS